VLLLCWVSWLLLPELCCLAPQALPRLQLHMLLLALPPLLVPPVLPLPLLVPPLLPLPLPLLPLLLLPLLLLLLMMMMWWSLGAKHHHVQHPPGSPSPCPCQRPFQSPCLPLQPPPPAPLASHQQHPQLLCSSPVPLNLVQGLLRYWAAPHPLFLQVQLLPNCCCWRCCCW
jgi:hypothetical protein